MRERFRARCMERAQRDRERKIRGRRGAMSEASSEADEEMADDEEGDEEMINDEVSEQIRYDVRHELTCGCNVAIP